MGRRGSWKPLYGGNTRRPWELLPRTQCLCAAPPGQRLTGATGKRAWALGSRPALETATAHCPWHEVCSGAVEGPCKSLFSLGFWKGFLGWPQPEPSSLVSKMPEWTQGTTKFRGMLFRLNLKTNKQTKPQLSFPSLPPHPTHPGLHQGSSDSRTAQ